jgi:hypothetical protein
MPQPKRNSFEVIMENSKSIADLRYFYSPVYLISLRCRKSNLCLASPDVDERFPIRQALDDAEPDFSLNSKST